MHTRPLRMRRIIQLHVWNAWPRFAYLLCNFDNSTMKRIKVICENNARPCVKRRMYPKCLIAVVSADVDLPYWTSKDGHIGAFTAIFSNICTVHAQERLFMNFRCKFRHHRSIRPPWFPIGVQNFSALATFSAAFCISYAKCPPYFYFRFVWPTDLQYIPHA